MSESAVEILLQSSCCRVVQWLRERSSEEDEEEEAGGWNVCESLIHQTNLETLITHRYYEEGKSYCRGAILSSFLFIKVVLVRTTAETI